MNEPHPQETLCLNCGHNLTGRFCSHCGQENTHLNVPFSHIVQEFLGDYIHFDSRVLSSIKLLLTKPGFLTKEFLEGKRVRHLPPLRMYFFVSVLFFLISPSKENSVDFSQDVTMPHQQPGWNFNVGMPHKKFSVNVSDDSLKSDTLTVQTESNMYHFFIEKLNRALRDPRGFNERFFHNLPTMMFILMPLAALLLKFLYYRTKRYYFEHLIFSLHLHTFFFALLLVVSVIEIMFGITPDGTATNILTLLSSVLLVFYLFKSLKTVYGQSNGKTVAKMGLLLGSDMFLLGILFSLTIVITAILF